MFQVECELQQVRETGFQFFWPRPEEEAPQYLNSFQDHFVTTRKRISASMDHGEVTKTTLEPAAPFPNYRTAPHQQGNVLASTELTYIITPYKAGLQMHWARTYNTSAPSL
ncbi:hypothetical protein TNCV_3002251 [Trichonephila clavipes]|nr:hypothetical protein TNCV_3002251 [Trichonephila clavipes]